MVLDAEFAGHGKLSFKQKRKENMERIVESRAILGFDIPFSDTPLQPRSDVRIRVGLARLGDWDELRFNKKLVRDLVVWSVRGVRVAPVGMPDPSYGELLQGFMVNESDIEVEEDKKWKFLSRKIRYRKK